MVFSPDRSKAVVPVLVVALWFIRRGDLFYVLPCVILFLCCCFFSPFSIARTSLWEERANLSAFRTFIRFALVRFCLFPIPLCLGKGCGSWLWHSLDFSLTFCFLIYMYMLKWLFSWCKFLWILNIMYRGVGVYFNVMYTKVKQFNRKMSQHLLMPWK